MTTWGMAIDLDKCTGCEACVVACRAENNLPVVGERQVELGRDMSWIRVNRVFEGEFPDVRAHFMPVLCQHCDEAPCVPVCPVNATYENPEGLNAQVYVRCIGTRYCAHACPYSVREFNFYDPVWPEPLDRQLNPDVFVRERGMIEKCTFCVQRIRRVKDKAKEEGRAVRDGEMSPACVQSCPAEAMYFGDLADPNSKVSQLASSPRAFHLLEELGTKPRVVYLKKGEWRADAVEPESRSRRR